MRAVRVVLLLCTFSALVVCGFATASASADTMYECAATLGSAQFKDAHCKESTTGGAGFRHVLVASPRRHTLTNITTGAARSTFKVKSVQSGVTLELQATEVAGEGTIENAEEGGVMFARGSVVITLSGVTVTAPAGKGCVVKTGTIKTNPLAETTNGLTNQLQLSSKSGPFAEFTIEGCTVAALNHAYEITGSLVGEADGSTITFLHTLGTAGLFKIFGQKAGAQGSITLKEAGGYGITFT